MYVLSAEVGHPSQKVRLIVDTGSSDLWLKSYHIGPGGKVGRPDMLLQYGMGKVVGSEVIDKFCVDELCIEHQAFVSATQISGIANLGAFDGLLGLAYPALAKSDRQTFLTEVQRKSPEFAGDLAFGLALQRETERSLFVLGTLDAVHEEAGHLGFQQKPVSLPVERLNGQAKFWMVRFGISVGNSSYAGHTGHTAIAAVDSGTSLLAVPQSMTEWTWERLLPGNGVGECGDALGYMVCPCNVAINPLTFTFKSQDSDRELQVELTRKDLLEVMGMQNLRGRIRQVCRLNLQPGPPNMHFWILGDVFLRRVYAVHDVVGHRMLFYPQKQKEVARNSSPFAAASRGFKALWRRWVPWEELETSVAARAPPTSLAPAAAASLLAAAFLGVIAAVGFFLARRHRSERLLDVGGDYCRL